MSLDSRLAMGMKLLLLLPRFRLNTVRWFGVLLSCGPARQFVPSILSSLQFLSRSHRPFNRFPGQQFSLGGSGTEKQLRNMHWNQAGVFWSSDFRFRYCIRQSQLGVCVCVYVMMNDVLQNSSEFRCCHYKPEEGAAVSHTARARKCMKMPQCSALSWFPWKVLRLPICHAQGIEVVGPPLFWQAGLPARAEGTWHWMGFVTTLGKSSGGIAWLLTRRPQATIKYWLVSHL